MKKIVLWIVSMLSLTVGVAMSGNASARSDSAGKDAVVPDMSDPAVAVLLDSINQSDEARPDSSLAVVGWFSKGDTVEYLMGQAKWRINGSDTILAASALRKVRINVLDSTAQGYKMKYTFLEPPVGNMPDSASAIEKFQNLLSARLSEKFVGTSFEFDTDEYGSIIGYEDMGKIKKQVKSFYKDIFKEIGKVPEIKELKKSGIDIEGIVKNADTDLLVAGYLQDLQLLFMYHGSSLEMGSYSRYEEASDSTFENTSTTTVSLDSDQQFYHIMTEETNVIPQSFLKQFMGGFVEMMGNDGTRENFENEFDSQVDISCVIRNILRMDYISNGWPFEIVKQRSTMLRDRGELRQTYITMTAYHFQ